MRRRDLRLPRPAEALVLAVLLTATAPARATDDTIQVWAAPGTRQVLPTDPVEDANHVWSTARQTVTLRAAAGESEGFHLVLSAGSVAANNLEVAASALAGSAGTIPASAVELAREVYFDVPSPSAVEGHPRLGTAGPHPDALIPFVDPYGSGRELGAPFTVEAGSNQPIWVVVEVPADAVAGAYEGMLEVSDDDTGASLATITLRVEVWGFSLPSRPSLATFFNLEAETVAIVYGISDSERLDRVVENHYHELARRRIGVGYSSAKLPAYDREAGFDWSADGAEAFWRRWLDDEQMPAVGAVPIYDITSAQYVIGDSSGSPYLDADFTPGSDFVGQARRFFARQWSDLEARGWNPLTVAFLDDESEAVSDEPYSLGEPAFDRVRSWAEILHHPSDADPNARFRLIVATDSVVPSASFADLRGACDVWDIYMDEVEEGAADYATRLASHPGEALWLVPNAYGDFIDYPAIYHRVLGWFAFKYGATGIEQWDVLAWFDAAENEVDPWVPGTLSPVWGWGGGGLFWPGANLENRGLDIDGPISSLRLELQRQSFEDYEYLAALGALGHEALAKGLAVGCAPGDLYHGLDITADTYERARTLAGTVLDAGGATVATVSGTVRTADGAPLAGALVGDGTSSAQTDAAGAYSLTVLAGAHTLNATADGCLPRAATVDLAPSSTTTGIDFTLSPLATDETALFGSFESDADLWEADGEVTVERSTAHSSDGAASMLLTFAAGGDDAGAFVDEISPADWSAADTLVFDLYNGSPYLTETDLELYDGTYALHTETLYLRPGRWTRAVVDLAATAIDLSDVAEMAIAAAAPGEGDRELWVDNLRLVRTTGADSSAPGAPTGLQASRTAAGVALEWTPPAADADGGPLTGLARYEVEGRVGGGSATTLNRFEEVTEPGYLDTEAPAGASVAWRVRALDQAGNRGPASDEATVGSVPWCASGPTVLCLNDGRFRVEASYETGLGASGDAHAVALTDDTGYLWFFNPNNVEVVVKVLDGCALSDHYWVFSAGLTNVEVELTVTDTETDDVKVYTNPQGTAYEPQYDTAAFATCH